MPSGAPLAEGMPAVSRDTEVLFPAALEAAAAAGRVDEGAWFLACVPVLEEIVRAVVAAPTLVSTRVMLDVLGDERWPWEALMQFVHKGPKSPGFVAVQCLHLAVLTVHASLVTAAEPARFAEVLGRGWPGRLGGGLSTANLQQTLGAVRVLDNRLSPLVVSCFDLALQVVVDALLEHTVHIVSESVSRAGGGAGFGGALQYLMGVVATAVKAGACCEPFRATKHRVEGRPDEANCLGLVTAEECPELFGARRSVGAPKLQALAASALWHLVSVSAVPGRAHRLREWLSADILRWLAHPCLCTRGLIVDLRLEAGWAPFLSRVHCDPTDITTGCPLGGAVVPFRFASEQLFYLTFGRWKTALYGTPSSLWTTCRGLLTSEEWAPVQYALATVHRNRLARWMVGSCSSHLLKDLVAIPDIAGDAQRVQQALQALQAQKRQDPLEEGEVLGDEMDSDSGAGSHSDAEWSMDD